MMREVYSNQVGKRTPVLASYAVPAGGAVTQLTAYNESDLSRIGLICPECGTESIFGLDQEHKATTDRSCPGCGRTDFLECFVRDARTQYNWVTFYRTARELHKRVQIRMYFQTTEQR